MVVRWRTKTTTNTPLLNPSLTSMDRSCAESVVPKESLRLQCIGTVLFRLLARGACFTYFRWVHSIFARV